MNSLWLPNDDDANQDFLPFSDGSRNDATMNFWMPVHAHHSGDPIPATRSPCLQSPHSFALPNFSASAHPNYGPLRLLGPVADDQGTGTEPNLSLQSPVLPSLQFDPRPQRPILSTGQAFSSHLSTPSKQCLALASSSLAQRVEIWAPLDRFTEIPEDDSSCAAKLGYDYNMDAEVVSKVSPVPTKRLYQFTSMDLIE